MENLFQRVLTVSLTKKLAVTKYESNSFLHKNAKCMGQVQCEVTKQMRKKISSCGQRSVVFFCDSEKRHPRKKIMRAYLKEQTLFTHICFYKDCMKDRPLYHCLIILPIFPCQKHKAIKLVFYEFSH